MTPDTFGDYLDELAERLGPLAENLGEWAVASLVPTFVMLLAIGALVIALAAFFLLWAKQEKEHAEFLQRQQEEGREKKTEFFFSEDIRRDIRNSHERKAILAGIGIFVSVVGFGIVSRGVYLWILVEVAPEWAAVQRIMSLFG